MVNSQGERRSRRKSRSRIRAYLYGSDRDAVQTSSDEEEGRNYLNGAARDMKKRMSRTGSSIMQIQSAKASTARLSKSESQGSDREDSVIIADQIKEKAYLDSLAAQNHITSPVGENKHPDSVMAPLRRKSLYTPGLATRTPNDILRKPPQLDSTDSQISRDYYFDPTKPPVSPLTQLASLGTVEDGRSTPSNINYTQLGGLRLGTLRVTNGTASPIPRESTPEILRQLPTVESKSDDEYYTSSERSMIDRNSTPLQPRTSSPLRFHDRDAASSQSAPFAKQSDHLSSPLRQQMPNNAVITANEYMAELYGSPFSYSEIPMSIESNSEDYSLDDEGIVIPVTEVPTPYAWRQFINDAESRHSITATPEDAFRRLNGEKPSVTENQCLSIPPSQGSNDGVLSGMPKNDSGYSSNASLSANHAIVADGLEGLQTDLEQQRPSRGVECCTGSYDLPQRGCIPGKSTSQLLEPVSVNQFLSKSSSKILPPSASSLKALSSSRTESPDSPSSHSLLVSSARKLQKPRPKSQLPPAAATAMYGSHETSQMDIPQVPSLIAMQHAERLRQFPLLEHTFPSSNHTTCNENTSPTNSSITPIRFPSPEDAAGSGSQNSPRIASFLGGRRRSRSRAPSRKRNSEIEDDGERRPLDIVRSPSWSVFGRRKSKEQRQQAKEEKESEKLLTNEQKELDKMLLEEQRDSEKKYMKDERKAKSSRSCSASRSRARSSERSGQNTRSLTIADFGTVTESLGGSPYDIATSMFRNQTRDASNWHPHQISTAMPRPKSVLDQDEALVGEAVRSRSRARSQNYERPHTPIGEGLRGRQSLESSRLHSQMMTFDAPPMPAMAAIDLKTHNLNWARSRRRSQSFSGLRLPSDSSFNDRGGLPGRSMRSDILPSNAPPVPALPPAQQIKQREAEIIRSRPQSIVVSSSPVEISSMLPRACRREDGVSLPSSPSNNAVTSPRKTRTSNLVPELWCHGSLEKKSPKAVDQPTASDRCNRSSSDSEGLTAVVDNVWEAQRRAWSQRRKSAGEALLRNQIRDMFGGTDSNSVANPAKKERPLSVATQPTAEVQELIRLEPSCRPSPKSLASFPNPLASNPHVSAQELYNSATDDRPNHLQRPASYHQSESQRNNRPSPSPFSPTTLSKPITNLPTPSQRRSQTQPHVITRKRVGSGASTPNSAFERLTGRYSGGLLYGYEPGCGLGGSAGTRGTRTEASRKSVDVSRGFGLDLSDVPIFVAASRGA